MRSTGVVSSTFLMRKTTRKKGDNDQVTPKMGNYNKLKILCILKKAERRQRCRVEGLLLCGCRKYDFLFK